MYHRKALNISAIPCWTELEEGGVRGWVGACMAGGGMRDHAPPPPYGWQMVGMHPTGTLTCYRPQTKFGER